MRTLTRFAVMGALIASCADQILAPVDQPICEVQFNILIDSMHAVFGTAERVDVLWYGTDGCFTNRRGGGQLPGSEITWTMRDPSVAIATPDGDESNPARTIVPRGSGSTYLVAEARELIDSALILVPDVPSLPPMVHVAAGSMNSCAASSDGTIFCWGDGWTTILGSPYGPLLGTCNGARCSPVPVPVADELGAVYLGASHACALDPLGQPWCWGENSSSQIGAFASTVPQPTPIPGGFTFRSMALGARHTCGLTSSGEAYCWGNPHDGRLGSGPRDDAVTSPEPVTGDLRFVSLAAGVGTCGVSESGRLYCWGPLPKTAVDSGLVETCFTVQYFKSRTDVQEYPCARTPVRMTLDTSLATDTRLQEVSGQCVLTERGAIHCFGGDVWNEANGFGPFASVSVGENHGCALTLGGNAFCWGTNDDGQLGDGGATRSSSVPLPVAGGNTYTVIAVGDRHTCAVTTEGVVHCWGDTSIGQVGADIRDDAWQPVVVFGQEG